MKLIRNHALAALCVLALLLVLPAGAGADAQVATRVDQLKYPPLRPFEIPQPQRVVLDNGMVVMLLEDRELPLVEVTALVRSGARLDPADKVGLSSLASNVLRIGGTTRMPSDQLDDWLEDRAATIEAGTADSLTRVFMTSLSQDFPEVLRVFGDVLRRPAFAADRLEVARNQAITAVSRQNENPMGIAFREFNKVVYGADSPLAWTPTHATLRAVSRDDIVAWHRRYFHADRVVLGLVGDFRSEEALTLVRQVFGDWPRGPAEAPTETPYRKQPSPGVFFVEKSDVPQSQVVMGHLGVRRDDPDYYALEVANQVLSGSFASRLFSNVRTRKGLAYTVFGGVFSAFDFPATTLLYMSTKKETTGAGIDSLLKEARDVVRDLPPTDEEVAKAKQGLLNSFVFRSDSPRRVLASLLNYEAYGYPLDWLTRYPKGIEAVTAEQVRQAAARHLRPEEFAILVVGPAEGQDRPLTDFGKVTPVELTAPGAPPARPAPTRK
ncbi:MAG TPA: pitrilysin family protein [Thermoanaerobaculia bacterium]|nr:pitrilysin family protein [Thermoanaerobaculia bacterium]